jgi:hypothetical protein
LYDVGIFDAFRGEKQRMARHSAEMPGEMGRAAHQRANMAAKASKIIQKQRKPK